MKKTLKLLSIFLLLSITANAAEYIPVQTNNTCLLLKVNDKKRLEQTYFGKRIGNVEEMKDVDLESYSAYSTFGTNHVFEAALRAIQADGNTSTELGYLASKVEKKDNNIIHTTISLKDEVYDLFVAMGRNQKWTKKEGEINGFCICRLVF